MSGVRVLITNNTLAERAGTELYVRDVAIGLLRRGYAPVAHSSHLGAVAEELRNATIPVIDDLSALSAPPDIIHGQHNLDTMIALLHFPHVPAVFFCHGWTPWQEIPPKFPRIRRYVAVCEVCAQRLNCEQGISENITRLILNFADLERFQPRAAPLPARPQRALVFNNYINPLTENAQLLRAACAEADIALDFIGKSADDITAAPEKILGNYDLIFAKGRSAIEGLVSGAAVICGDAKGMGEMITTENFERIRRVNFGIRVLQSPFTKVNLAAQMARYDATDAAEVAQRARAACNLERALDEITAVYAEVLAEHRNAPAADFPAEQKAAAAYLRALTPHIKTPQELTAHLENELRFAQKQLNKVTATRTWRILNRLNKIRRTARNFGSHK